MAGSDKSTVKVIKQKHSKRSKKKTSQNKNETQRIIKIYYTNVRSLKNKINELKIMAAAAKPDIIALTETWLHDDIGNSEINIDSYSLIRKDRHRVANSRGGGVAFYIKDNIRVHTLSENDDRSLEMIWLEIATSIKNDPLVIGLYYRAPNINIQDSDVINKSIKDYCTKNTIIIGDFNHPNIDWKTMQPNGDTLCKKFIKTVNDNFLRQLVKNSTRGDNILDLILTNNTDKINDVQVECPLSNSDHNSIVFTVNSDTEKVHQNKRVFIDYENGDYEGMKSYLSDINWADVFNAYNIEDNWKQFKSIINTASDKYIPTRIFTSNSNSIAKKPKWLSSKIDRLIARRNAKWKQFSKKKLR